MTALFAHLSKRIETYRWRDELAGIVMLGFVGLVLAILAPHIAPTTPLRHLDQGRLHIGVGFGCAAFAFLILKARLRAVLSVLACALVLASLAHFAWGQRLAMAPERTADFSLLSFNVLGFNPRGQEVADFIVETAPDVAFILEAPAVHEHLSTLWSAFPYNAGCGPGDRCDMAVFSKHPLLNVDIIPFFTIPGRLIQAQIALPEGTVTLLAAHLTKPYYGQWHDRQLELLVERLAQIEGPVVLAGDFNSQPFVRAFRQTLLDRAGMRLASQMEPTWPALSSTTLSRAGFAIDHVLVRGGLAPVSVELIEDPVGSNHRGFVSHFGLDGR